jgi:hypothetical protein
VSSRSRRISLSLKTFNSGLSYLKVLSWRSRTYANTADKLAVFENRQPSRNHDKPPAVR